MADAARDHQQSAEVRTAARADDARRERGAGHRICARAAAWTLGADRFEERMWRQLEAQAGVDTAVSHKSAKPEHPTDPGQAHCNATAAWLEDQHPKYME